MWIRVGDAAVASSSDSSHPDTIKQTLVFSRINSPGVFFFVNQHHSSPLFLLPSSLLVSNDFSPPPLTSSCYHCYSCLSSHDLICSMSDFLLLSRVEDAFSSFHSFIVFFSFIVVRFFIAIITSAFITCIVLMGNENSPLSFLQLLV